MNYIKQLNTIFDRLAIDDRLNPTHISLYLSLFQFWNRNHFRNPFNVSRSRVMKLSKISSTATYHKCIRNLEQYGYLHYKPSYNPFFGSLVTMQLNFNTPVQKTSGSENNLFTNQTEPVPVENSHHSPTIPINEPVLNRKHKNKNSIKHGHNHTGLKNEQVNSPLPQGKNGKREGPGAAPGFSTPALSEIHNYFLEQKADPAEAEKFFNYFQSNGWLVGGRTPMKDWKAAARNWIINARTFSHHPKASLKPNHLQTPEVKNYAEPL